MTTPFDKEAGIRSAVGGFVMNRIAPMFVSGLKPLAAGAKPAAATAGRAAANVFGGGAVRTAGGAAGRTVGGLQRGQLASQAAARTTGAMAPLPKPQTNTAGHLAWNAVRGGLGFGAADNATRTGKAVAGMAGVGMIAAPLAMGGMSSSSNAQNPYSQQMGMQVTASDEGGLYTVKTGSDEEESAWDRSFYPRAAAGAGLSLLALHRLGKQGRSNIPKTFDPVTGLAAAGGIGLNLSVILDRQLNRGEKTAFSTPDKVRAGVDLASYGALAAPLATKLLAPNFYNQHHGLMHGLDVAGLAGLTSTGLYGMATGKGKDRQNDALDVGGLGLMGLALHRRLSEH